MLNTKNLKHFFHVKRNFIFFNNILRVIGNHLLENNMILFIYSNYYRNISNNQRVKNKLLNK
jgi:hypothetical protein